MPSPAPNSGRTYAEKQLRSPLKLLAFSHGARFETARRLVKAHAGKKLLDYGCGDGTFLESVKDLFPRATGADTDPNQLAHCRRLLPEGTFVDPGKVKGTFDVLICMEVFEHCLDDKRGELLDRLRGWLAPGGVLVLSVPIEMGPVLLVKEAARWTVGLRNPDYRAKEVYGWGELVKQLFAGPRTQISRPVWNGGYGHKGFNWRRLEIEIEARFQVRRRLYSPFPLLGPWLNSQVWWVLSI